MNTGTQDPSQNRGTNNFVGSGQMMEHLVDLLRATVGEVNQRIFVKIDATGTLILLNGICNQQVQEVLQTLLTDKQLELILQQVLLHWVQQV